VDAEPVQLDEAALVEQYVQPLAGGQLAVFVLLPDTLVAATLLRLLVAAGEFISYAFVVC
jgi:hypothetical protein